MENLTGLDTVLANLDAYERQMMLRIVDAGREIADHLANYAKQHHGHATREARFVYPGGGVKRWRSGGVGWGDVTGQLQQSTVAEISEVAREYVMIALSAGASYAVFVELARQGRWAWLWPAVTESKDRIMTILNRHLAS